ncbi:hypothetical protein YenMTG1_048 [Yersinia phage vB_YenM_TG1]|uniref:Uncharacterized protein n=1 Tax=Yersinia phage vB_YenM_TG1 TaxID=1589265 RepID=A0A0B5A453_9CAUD|nr:hypothetical protein AVV33_gp048 [Yersinia phage vB_YenM_TG1]AJD81856.1 hypothetical protein YenMTG1_048 [Yersinia phage vB_YenM_TG1]
MSKFIVPIYSMRSYSDNKYAVLKDGNLQLHLNRAVSGDIITVPKNSSDIDECCELFPEFHFVPLQYKENAYETRKHFWLENQWIVDSLVEYYDCDELITDITGYRGNHSVIFNFNITMDPNIARSYIDEFIEIDVESVNFSRYTTVLNNSQKDTLVRYGAEPDNIIVTTKVIRPSVIERYAASLEPIFLDGVFHPFRISDPCYNFNEVVDVCIGSNKTLYITDPNCSFCRSKYPSEVNISPIKLSKREYYQVLKGKPEIVYLENPEKVFHPGLAEFIYFNALIYSPYNIPTYDDVVIKEDVWHD